jgi:parvulin-like peptidyl-prolyl isomerase
MNSRTLSTLAFAALACGTLSAATVVNRTIATVNGEAILLSEFDKNWTAYSEQQKGFLPAEKMTPAWENETKQKLLDQMIDDKVLLQEAKKRKVRVNQRELENGVVQVKARFLPENGRRDLDELVQRAMASRPAGEDGEEADVDLPALWAELSKRNPGAIKAADEKFKAELAKEGLTQKKFEERIRDQLSVVTLTQQEVRAKAKPVDDEEGKALFAQIQKVMQGQKVESQDPERAADLESLAKFFNAQTGERVRARHILIEVPQDASFKDKSAARKKIEDLRAQIAKGADFAELAEKHSHDKGSAARGGDLGAFGKGQMVPSFEKAAFALNVGQLSDVVETQFGYHILKVEEKRAATKLRYEDVQDDLKEYVFRSKAQETFETFVKDLRKDASVKVLIDPAELPGKK